MPSVHFAHTFRVAKLFSKLLVTKVEPFLLRFTFLSIDLLMSSCYN